ncbi:MAG: GTP-binding protein [Saprospiraceae bacterium]|nr:GTP-binding protein [Saprospiraceae bacterium]
MNGLINQSTDQYQNALINIIDALHQMTVRIQHSELEQTVKDIKDRVVDPFMFVIVGEVKAGKSSFINALLESEKEICKVAASPMTDTIQQIVYGEKESVIEINPFLKRITQPVDILKDIAIVDTPGTNTIIDHHQEITENFIPTSDLIVFVFEAKNPYRESSWKFFDFIKEEWHKKVIFVLQQKDLLSQDDLETNINGVKEQAARKGMIDAPIFAVSALQELNKNSTDSGFKVVRDFISDNITGGRAPFLKLLNVIGTVRTINLKISAGVEDRKAQYRSDLEFREDIKQTLDRQEERTKRQVQIMVENLLAAYDRTTSNSREELKSGIGFVNLIKRSIQATFNSAASPKKWLDGITAELENALNAEFKDKLQEGVLDIAESIQDMARIIDVKIKDSTTILKNDHEIFSDIAEKRSQVLKDLQNAFATFLKRSENFYQKDIMGGGENFAPQLAAGSGVAIVGIVLSTLTNTMVMDITGGILTAVGLIFAGITVGLNRSKILKSFDREVASGRTKIEDEITLKLNNYTLSIKQRIDDNFNQFDDMLRREEQEIESLTSSITQVDQNLVEVKDSIDKVLS